MNGDFSKIRNSMRYWLLGAAEFKPEFYAAVKALDYAQEFHQGLRKDGKTPEFFHQVSIAGYLRTMHRNLMHPAETFAVSFLHDVPEDYRIGHEEIAARFGMAVSDPVRRLTKKFRGVEKDKRTYFEEMAECPVSSVVKGGDRINNVQTMIGVFDKEKQENYLEEVEVYFLPMLKTARRAFPSQEPIYENIKLMLLSQSELIRASHAGLLVKQKK